MNASCARRTAVLITSAVALTAGSVVLAGCGSSSEAPASGTQAGTATSTATATAPAGTTSTAAADQPGTGVYGEGNQTIVVTPHGEFTVELATGNGEQWQLTPSGDATPNLTTQSLDGGKSIWVFEAPEAGNGTLAFTQYTMDGSKGRVVTFDLSVAPG